MGKARFIKKSLYVLFGDNSCTSYFIRRMRSNGRGDQNETVTVTLKNGYSQDA